MPREKALRAQLHMTKSLVNGCSLETARKGQEILGNMMAFSHRGKVRISSCYVGDRRCLWALPFDEQRVGVILYLHGGGFTCGDVEYAGGFGSMLASECSIRVLCASYRLAPEHPFPAALEDCLAAYRYLLDAGYAPSSIVLCGESAGGGLIYSLCFRLKELALPLPAGLIAVSPWVDLTQSSPSYEINRDVDPSMTKERLDFYARCYTNDPRHPLVSPLFGDPEGLPPSLIFVGGDEVMLDDSRRLCQSLTESGCSAQLIERKGLWHAYVLFGLKEYREQDMAAINGFLDGRLPQKRKLRWMKLDNAAKIYPAARRKNWNNVFRLSFTLKEEVDPIILQSALDVTVRRFPSIAVRLRRGLFWYYLEEIRRPPAVKEDRSTPLYRMPFDDVRTCAFRALYYRRRIAVEFYHAVTDGTGGAVFLKSLVCEYLMQKHAVPLPCTHGILDRLTPPDAEELEDAFLKYAGEHTTGRKDTKAYRVQAPALEDGYLFVTTGELSVQQLRDKAREKGVSITEYLTAVLIESLLTMQKNAVSRRRSWLPVKVQIPVNLRKLFPSRTLRNFVYFYTMGIDPGMGDFSFDEILQMIHHQAGIEGNAKLLRSRFTTNVNTEKQLALKLIPLFIKNIAMKAVYRAIGEKTATLAFSNLGRMELPEEMDPYVDYADFLLTAQEGSPYNCSAVSYGDRLRYSIVRNTAEPELERLFFTGLVKRGIRVKVESNDWEEEQDVLYSMRRGAE